MQLFLCNVFQKCGPRIPGHSQDHLGVCKIKIATLKLKIIQYEKPFRELWDVVEAADVSILIINVYNIDKYKNPLKHTLF